MRNAARTDMVCSLFVRVYWPPMIRDPSVLRFAIALRPVLSLALRQRPRLTFEHRVGACRGSAS
ncbi:protein of unknown function [Methylocella tundrae]|uniref:Uncharacterized protein n=1 Tax=Methylocella tundrae TaxID=227605 RepID=A0A4U8Z4F1_METTU|nr:protein of unknown function [Methylocella tundrae]